jgi:adenylate cyclase
MHNARGKALKEPACSADEIRIELEAILDSAEFVGSPRDRDFLRYVIEEALAGRGERLKAFSIATEVFGRDARFDPETDPVVRTTAARVRRALERYYLLTNCNSGILIEVPKGGYEPVFLRVASERTEAVSDSASAIVRVRRVAMLVGVPALAIAIFALAFYAASQTPPVEPGSAVVQTSPPRIMVALSTIGGGQDRDAPAQATAADLTDQIIGQLSKFREFQVIGPELITQARSPVETPIQQRLGVAYVLAGGVLATESRVRLTARLVETVNGGVIWAHAYDKPTVEADLVAARSAIAREVVIALGQPYGIIFRAEQMRLGGVSDPASYSCTSQYYRYRAARSALWHRSLRDCLESAVARLSSNPVAWGTLAVLYVDEARFAYNRKGGATTALDRAKEAAQNALRLDPDDTRALEALMLTLGVAGDHDGSLRMGERAVALNPNDTELSAELGQRMCMAGEPDRGSALIRQALELNPAHAGFYNGSLSFCAYVLGDFEAAVGYVAVASPDQHQFYNLLAAISLAQVGRLHEAGLFAVRFRAQRPDFVKNWDMEWTGRLRRARDKAAVREGAEKAGLIDPLPASSLQRPEREAGSERG